ncbi:NAD(+) kinase [Campylobacter sp. CCUG 57310]|uniref:NAD(+) kinase n=1 Tax=Campylobacter sp. CCUG 57310 TaxID=2517362 RepID=UPI001564B8B6|nr:NAD(+) kinase [Campylobacter sp. CCUG 57310]QKF92531.1 inorganic polyphosphate/ATP-NAD kinase [Campylobacter sp. CCUG 57310]
MKKERNLNIADVKKVGVIAKINADLAKNLKTIEKILAKYGVEILLEKSCAKEVDKQGFELINLAKNCDFLISLGGDGTIISVCRQSAEISPFVLGIHAGRLGFLTDITMDECEGFFKDFFEGKFDIETPFMLDVFMHKKSGDTVKKIAFNEAAILSLKPGSMAHINALLNGKDFNSYFGDGVLISTPIGSTAYNMSANGPIIYPLSDVFAVTPICSHSLTQRPVVLPRGFEMKFKTQSDAVLVIDGQDRFNMSNLDSVSVALSEKSAKFIRHIGRDYFQILKEKLHWGYND